MYNVYIYSIFLSDYRCGNKVQKVEKSALGTVFVCVFGAPKHDTNGCRRTYLSLRDLQSHVAHRHLPKTTSDSKTSHSAPLTSSHTVNLPLPLTQQQAAIQGQGTAGNVSAVHSVPPQPASVSILQTTGHSGSHSQQHSPAMPPVITPGGPPALSPRASPLVQVSAPTSNPAVYHPYGAPVHSGSDQSVYRPLDMAPFSQKQQPPQQHQIIPQQQPIHHMPQHPPHKQDIGHMHPSHGNIQQGTIHQGHSNLPHDMSRRHDVQPGHVLPPVHNLPPGGNHPQGMNPQDHHIPQRHNIPGPNVAGDNNFMRNEFQTGRNLNQQEFQSEHDPRQHDLEVLYSSDQNPPIRDYQLDHAAPPRRDFQSEQNHPRMDYQRDSFGREQRPDFQGDHNAPREFQDETKFTRPDFHDNDMRMGQGSHPSHNQMNMMNTSRTPYSQSSQMTSPNVPLMANSRSMSPSHGSHPDLSPIQGGKDNFNNSQNTGSGARTNVNLITVPIQDEGQYRPLPFVNPSQGNTSFSQTHPKMQMPAQSYPQSNNPPQGGMFPNSQNNQNQMTGGPIEIIAGGNNSQNHGFNQGPRMNVRPGMGPNMGPGMQQGNFNNRPPGGGMMGNPRNQGPNNPRNPGQMGSPRFNSGNRWPGPRGPRMSQNHQRPRGEGPRGNYYKN